MERVIVYTNPAQAYWYETGLNAKAGLLILVFVVVFLLVGQLEISARYKKDNKFCQWFTNNSNAIVVTISAIVYLFIYYHIYVK